MEAVEIYGGIQDTHLPITHSSNTNEKEKSEIVYEEVLVGSFSEAVERIKGERITNANTGIGYIVDIDGVFFDDIRVKLPIASHYVNLEIPQESQDAYNKLKKITKGRIAICTNRSENEQFLFNSKEVLKEVYKLVNPNPKKTKIPIFTGLFKQIPGLTKEDISKHDNWTLDPVIKTRIDSVVHYLGKLLTESDYKSFSITSIEDRSIVSLNRKTFLMYVAKQLKKEYGIEIGSIRNYVIRR